MEPVVLALDRATPPASVPQWSTTAKTGSPAFGAQEPPLLFGTRQDAVDIKRDQACLVLTRKVKSSA